MQPTKDALEGRVVGGDFEVVRPLASGGMGAVYEVIQRSTGKARALKVMHTWLLRDDRARARFLDEARLAGTVDSDHVVEVVSAGIDEELGAPWIAMELLRGRTLTDHVAELGPLSPEECLEVLFQARHGLAFAHARGIVHRDLKPDNIFVADARRRGVPFTIKVLDFGIAKWIHEVKGGMKNSQAMGTPSWMAPEQLTPGKEIGPATDVWALGLLAFWMLSGKEYWLAANSDAGSVSAVLLELVTSAPEPASERAARLGASRAIPARFDPWLERCLKAEPAQRFADAGACIDALADALEGAVVGSAPELDLEAVLRAEPSISEDVRRAITGSAAVADDDPAWWAVHAAAAQAKDDTPSLSTLSQWLGARKGPRPMARPLGPDGLRELVWAGSSALHPLSALCERLLPPLVLAATRRVRASSDLAAGRARPLPRRVTDAVRHASLILGVPAEVVGVPGDEPPLRVLSFTPVRLGASSAVRAETSTLALRAHAAAALAGTRLGLGVIAVLASADELEEVRKAAQALARGTISPSPYYRPLVSQLGPRRHELARALEAAEGIDSGEWWRAAEETVARAALLACADIPSAARAVAELHPNRAADGAREALCRFVIGPDFAELWHRPSSSLA